MAYNLKEEITKPNRMAAGHKMCAGCGAPTVVNTVLRALDSNDHAVITAATRLLRGFYIHISCNIMERFIYT